MSKAALFWVTEELLEDSRLSHTESRVIHFMAKRARDDFHHVWWSQEKIAKAVHCSKGAVNKAVAKFQKLGLVNTKQSSKEGSIKKYNTYFLCVPYEYRRRGHKGANGKTSYEDWDHDGFNEELYEERISMEFDEHEMEYQAVLNDVFNGKNEQWYDKNVTPSVTE